MSKSILCAIDISEPGVNEKVLKTAAKLAEIDGARLDVITVVPNFGMSIVSSYFKDDFQEKATSEAKRLLKETVTNILGTEADSEIRHIVASGSIYEEILRVSHQTESDLIVIGAQAPDIKDYLLGPNAARVVRHSKASVFVVRPD